MTEFRTQPKTIIPWIIGGIVAGAGMISSWDSNQQNRKMQKNQMEQQEKWSQMYYDREYEWRQEDIEMNKPINKIKGMQEAGLHPMYGSGGGMGGGSIQSTSGSQPRGSSGYPMQPEIDASVISQAALNMAQARLTEIEADNKDTQMIMEIEKLDEEISSMIESTNLVQEEREKVVAETIKALREARDAMLMGSNADTGGGGGFGIGGAIDTIIDNARDAASAAVGDIKKRGEIVQKIDEYIHEKITEMQKMQKQPRGTWEKAQWRSNRWGRR